MVVGQGFEPWKALASRFTVYKSKRFCWHFLFLGDNWVYSFQRKYDIIVPFALKKKSEHKRRIKPYGTGKERTEERQRHT